MSDIQRAANRFADVIRNLEDDFPQGVDEHSDFILKAFTKALRDEAARLENEAREIRAVAGI
jgi:hypothetical protein